MKTCDLDPVAEIVLSKIAECELETGSYCRWGKGLPKREEAPGVLPGSRPFKRVLDRRPFI